MAPITNPKLSSVVPDGWRSYPGLSVLYDNPGCSALSGLEPLGALSAGCPPQPLYRRLRVIADELESSPEAAHMELYTLPRHAYHVTLCDGVNAGTRTHVRPAFRQEVGRTLDELPDSLLWGNALMRILQDRELSWSVWSHPITFRVEALHVWGQVLAASLGPADEESVAAKAKHEASRSGLAERLRSQVGLQVQQWRPHVSLGYFANEKAAARARDHVIPPWHEYARERTEGLSITFRSAAVYGFTDMVRFWRLAH